MLLGREGGDGFRRRRPRRRVHNQLRQPDVPRRALRRPVRPAPVVARPALVPLYFIVRAQRRARPAPHASSMSERAAVVVVGLGLLDINLVLGFTRRRTQYYG